MRLALVEFVVQIPDDVGDGVNGHIALMQQARRHLNNNGGRVDFNARFLSSAEEANGMSVVCIGQSYSLPAEYLSGSDGRDD